MPGMSGTAGSSSPSTTTIVSNPLTLCFASASIVRWRIDHRLRVGMTTLSPSGDSSVIEGNCLGPHLVLRPEVLDDTGRRTAGQDVRRDRARDDRIGGDEGSS